MKKGGFLRAPLSWGSHKSDERRKRRSQEGGWREEYRGIPPAEQHNRFFYYAIPSCSYTRENASFLEPPSLPSLLPSNSPCILSSTTLPDHSDNPRVFLIRKLHRVGSVILLLSFSFFPFSSLSFFFVI